MGKFSGMQTSFNGGELSPLIAGRPDVAKYANGCKRMVGFLPTVQGPAKARPGFRYVTEVKTSANRTWLLRFEFSVEDSYMLEFGDLYIRFYTNRGQVESAPSVPYEIVSPYSAADLTNSDGSLALRWVQTGDVVYIVHPDHPPYKLSRLAATNWTLAAVDFLPPPFKELNTTTTTVYASAATGAGITLTANSAIFTASHAGQYIYLGEKDVRDVKQWEAGKAVVIGDVRRSDGKNYSALTAGTTGGNKPTHSSGAAYDGDAVQWQFLDPGYGWAKITAYTDTTHVTATVVSRLPSGAVLVANATTRWAFQAWNATDGYPSSVTFFRERLVFSRNSTLWFSVTADFENFATEIDGEITADAGFERTIASDRTNSIRWLSPGDVLLIGTLGDEWAITESTTTDPFGPANCKTKRQSTYGSNMVAPMRAGSDTLFVQKAGRKVRAMAFRYEEDGFESPDVTVFAEHITKTGIIDIAFQQEPWSVVWAARADGVLLGCTYNREQDVVAWHRHPLSGGIVECVESIPSPNGSRDDLWIICRYTINGVTKRYIAYLEAEDDEDTVQADWAYSDMMATYSGAPATNISGLGYLEGQEVWVLADGARHPNRTVTAGAITLQAAASKVQVGLPSEALIETMNLEGGSNGGTAQGKTKRAQLATLRVDRSLGGRAGTSETNLVEMQFRSTSVPMGSAPPPFTGDIPIEWPGDYDTQMTFVFKKDRPMPMTIVAVMPQAVVSEGR